MSQKSQKKTAPTTTKTTSTQNCFDQLVTDINSRSRSSQSNSTHHTKSTSSKSTSKKSTPPVDFTKYADKHTPTKNPFTGVTQIEGIEDLIKPSDVAFNVFPYFGLNPLKNMFTRYDFINETHDADSTPAFNLPAELLGNLIAQLYMEKSCDYIMDHYYNNNPVFVHFYDGGEAIFFIDDDIEKYLEDFHKSTKPFEDKIQHLYSVLLEEGLPLSNEYKCPDCVDKIDGMYFAVHDALYNPSTYGLIVETEPGIFAVTV